jgi:hypothetical protein
MVKKAATKVTTSKAKGTGSLFTKSPRNFRIGGDI